MKNINYSLIGTISWCDEYRNQLEDLMVQARAGDQAAELIVVNCAAHFYGLDIANFETTHELMLAIEDADHELFVK